FYNQDLLAKVGSVIRQVKPEIVLTHSPEEYMEDHSNTCRLTVTAAFCRAMTNFTTQPQAEIFTDPVTVYHAMPYGLRTPLRLPIIPEFSVEIGDKVEDKKAMLACHKSQKEWLDVSQGQDSYLTTLEELSREMGTLSGVYAFAECWRRHSHLGFCGPDDDPLGAALQDRITVNPDYPA
ncbi:MAG: PIG-L deacetylase family protein, partial [Planctomycetota bacterium]